MTEKRYDYSELKDGTYGVFKDKYYDDIDISFSQRFCIVENEEQARSIVGQLNGLVDENEQLKQEIENGIESFKKIQRCHTLTLVEENKQLKQELTYWKELLDNNLDLQEENERLKQAQASTLQEFQKGVKKVQKLAKENEQLKQQKPFLKIIDDYFIQYEDREFFNLHKPSDIRSLIYILNREHGYSELQCEYNDLEKGDVE